MLDLFGSLPLRLVLPVPEYSSTGTGWGEKEVCEEGVLRGGGVPVSWGLGPFLQKEFVRIALCSVK